MTATTATKTPSATKLWQFARRIWDRINDHDVLGRAAQLSYYFLLALFPLLLFLISLLGYIAPTGSEFQDRLLNYLSTVAPPSAMELIRATLDEISARRSGGRLYLSLLAALWAASWGMGAISETLNVAYRVKESRPWWKARLVAVLLTIALAVLILSAFAIVLYGERIGDSIAAIFGYSEVFRLTWRISQWPIALTFVLATFKLIYYFAPNVPRHSRKWTTTGAIVGVVLWLIISFGFRAYLSFFDSYSVTYGSLGAVIILMLWFYLTGVAILIGGEINAELEGFHKEEPQF
ncbi:MAG TPA: YihY/virulence factor BrkB family protein [Pyrinomonadaceae bacterium]|nr:YihY/virulence factor BrkB family protein [Pyrinomonadaceae bacterium]